MDKSYVDEANQIALELIKDQHSGATVVQEQQASVNARFVHMYTYTHHHDHMMHLNRLSYGNIIFPQNGSSVQVIRESPDVYHILL